MDIILKDIWTFIQADASTKLFFLVVIYFILKLSRKIKLLGIFLQAQDHAIERVIANGKGNEYREIREKKIEVLMRNDNFENQFKNK